MRWYMAFASALLALCGTSLGFADAGQSNSDAYEEVYLNLDEETKALGGGLYAQHCAVCHDGNVVRAPQRYILEQGSPETILAAMVDGAMREVSNLHSCDKS